MRDSNVRYYKQIEGGQMVTLYLYSVLRQHLLFKVDV